MAKSALPRRLFAPAPPMPDPSRPPSLIGPRFAPSPGDVSSRTLRTEKLPRRRHRARRTRSGSFPADAGPVRGAAARSRSVEKETPSHGALRLRCGDEHRGARATPTRMVGAAGFEPASPFGPRVLSPLRLPVSSRPRQAPRLSFTMIPPTMQCGEMRESAWLSGPGSPVRGPRRRTPVAVDGPLRLGQVSRGGRPGSNPRAASTRVVAGCRLRLRGHGQRETGRAD